MSSGSFKNVIYKLCIYQPIGKMVTVLTNSAGDWGSITGQVIPKTQKMVLDTSLLNTQNYKVQIKSKIGNPGKGEVLSLTVAIKREAFRSVSTTVSQLTYAFTNHKYLIYMNYP